jgi:hypothetical protein
MSGFSVSASARASGWRTGHGHDCHRLVLLNKHAQTGTNNSMVIDDHNANGGLHIRRTLDYQAERLALQQCVQQMSADYPYNSKL